MDNKPLSVEYQVTFDDAIDFLIYCYDRSPTLRKARFSYKWLSSLILIVVGLLGGAALHDRVFTLIFSAGAVTWLFLADRNWYRVVRKRYEKLLKEGKHTGLLGTWRLDIGPEEMRTSNGQVEAAWKMTTVESVDVTPSHCYIFTGLMDARLVPRRAFPGNAEFDEFVEAVRSFRQ